MDFEVHRLVGSLWLQTGSNFSGFKILSRFLTICYDIFLDEGFLQLLFSTFVLPLVSTWELVRSTLDSYHFKLGSFYYGGFLPHSDLLDNGHCGELLFELRMGLICDRLGDTLKSFEILLDWVSPQFVDKALVFLMALHSLLSLGFLSSAPPRLEFPL